MRKITLAAFFTLLAAPAMAHVCADGTILSWSNPAEAAAAEKLCKKKHGGVYATCYSERAICVLTGIPAKGGKTIKLPF